MVLRRFREEVVLAGLAAEALAPMTVADKAKPSSTVRAAVLQLGHETLPPTWKLLALRLLRLLGTSDQCQRSQRRGQIYGQLSGAPCYLLPKACSPVPSCQCQAANDRRLYGWLEITRLWHAPTRMSRPGFGIFAITSVLNERAPGRVGSRRLNLAEQVDTLKRFTFADEIMALSADRGSLWLRRRAQ